MANIKNFGLSGVSGDVQFGKAGGRVVYDAGSSVFKVTQSDGTTLDNIRVATTPANANDAASKAYVDSVASTASGDTTAVQNELDATQTGAGLSAAGAYVAPTTSNYHNAATSLANADFLIDAAVKSGLDAAATDRGNIRSEFAAADSALDTSLKAYADQAESDAVNTAAAYTDGEIATLNAALSSDIGNVASDLATEISTTNGEISALQSEDAQIRLDFASADTGLANDLTAKIGDATVDGTAGNTITDRINSAETDAKAYTDAREIAITSAYQSYADQAEADAKAYADQILLTENELSEMNDVALGTLASGDLLMYNGTAWVNADVSTSDIDEGTNLYYTDARARAAISVSGDLAYNASTGVISFVERTDAEVRGLVSAAGDLSYNATTGVFSVTTYKSTDFDTDFAAKSTTDLSEGSNLYFTGARAIAAVEGEATLDLTGALTVAGATTLSQATKVVSGTTKALGSDTINVFSVVDSADAGLLEVKENGDVTIGGILTVNGAGTSTFAGDVSINGAITVAGDATFLANVSGNTMTMSGDLTVNGDTLLTQTVEVKSDVTLAAADANVNVFHVTSSDGAELFEVRQNGDAIVGGTLTINGDGATLSGGLSAGDITAANAAFTGNVSINGNLTVDGDSTFVGTISGNDMNLAGNLIIGDADTDYVTFNADVNSNIIPDANLTYDLGSATKKWNNIYVGTVNATTLIGSLTGQVSDISNHEAYIEGLFSVVDNGGDGSLSYANGVFTYTGPSAAEVRAHFTAGTGVAINAGEISIGQSVGTTDNVTFNDVTVSGSLFSNDITAADVVVNGNLTVTGTTTTVNTETIELADNIIVFNSNATGSATQDAGIEIERGDDANKSLLWDETNDRWTVGGETFVAATFIGNLTGDVTGTVSDISNHDTDSLAEGSVNLYYTDARVAAYLTTNAYATEAYTDAKVADKDSFALRASLGTSGSVGTIVNVAGKTYYVSRIVVDVTTAYDADVSISDGTNTLMSAANIEEGVVGTYVAEMDFSTATAGGATISLVSAATAGAATVTVEYVQL